MGIKLLRSLSIRAALVAACFFTQVGHAQSPPQPPATPVVSQTTALLSVSTTSARIAFPASTLTFNTVYIYNDGSTEAFFATGSSSVVANANCIALPPGTGISVWIGSATYVAGVTTSGTSTLRITQANGAISYKGGGPVGGTPSSIPLASLANIPSKSITGNSTGTTGPVTPLTALPTGLDTSVGTATATGATATRANADRFADVFNIKDYGAVCDGVTNDNAAINATTAAMYNSIAYQNNNAVTMVGPSGATHKGCVMNSINLTYFNKGTGANTRPRVTIRDMTWLCTGAGNICADALGSDFVRFQNVSIRGDSAAPPEVCIQIGQIVATSAAWNATENVHCNNEFTFTALYNFASEDFTSSKSMWVNSHTSSGAINALGSITAGSGYSGGPYQNVPLTGGSGSGALATIAVSAGGVSSVMVTYEGRDYSPGDVLSASTSNLGSSGSGFSIPVATIQTFAVVYDGQNHWRANSAFQTETLPVETWQSLTLGNFLDSSIRMLGSGTPLWVGWSGGLHLTSSYILNNTGLSCVTVFDNGVLKLGIPGPNWGLDLDFNCEGASLSSMLNFAGQNATPVLQDFRFRGYHQATSTFSTATNISSVSINNADIDLKFGVLRTGVASSMFSSAKLWTLSGRIAVPSPSNWNAPQGFQGQLIVGAQTTPFGPIDILPGAALAVSCARQLVSTYTGPLCQLQRASDNLTIDLYPTASGTIDRNALNAFCNSTTCAVKTAYDQSGNGNNFVQTTAASQPAITIGVTALNNRPAMFFGDQSAFAMTAPASSSINDLFATGGYVSTVTDQTGNANAADRVLYKSNGSTTGFGWDYQCGFVGTSRKYSQAASTSGGLWSTSSYLAAAHIEDIQYSTASISNAAVLSSDGNFTVNSSTQPVGSITTDAAQPLLLGNNAATGGNRGFPGYIAEVVMWKATPTATQLEAIRRNQAAYYGVANVN